MIRFLNLLLLVFATARALAESPAEMWPQFRGPGGSGIAENDQLPIEWGPGRNVAWSVAIPGTGWSSPVVWGDRIFLTTAIPDKDEIKAPKGMRPENIRYAIPDITYDWRVLCLSLKDGSRLWEKSVKTGKPDKGKHPKNSYATETPATDGQRLYVFFSQAGLFAFDFDGHVLWEQHPGSFETYLEYGTSSSPITDGKQVFLQCDNEQSSSIAAFDCRTGRENWRDARDETTSWSTPCLWQNALRTELVTVGPRNARSYDPVNGNLLWELGGLSGQSVPVPVADQQFCYISSGWLAQPNKPVLAIRPGATGVITPPAKTETTEFVGWRNGRAAPYVPSPIVYRERLFIVGDGAIVESLDLKTGMSIYGRKRLPQGGPFTASPWAYQGKVFCLTEGGLCYAIDAGDEYNVAATNPPLDQDGLFLATPAIAGNALLIRGARQLHCIRTAPAP